MFALGFAGLATGPGSAETPGMAGDCNVVKLVFAETTCGAAVVLGGVVGVVLELPLVAVVAHGAHEQRSCQQPDQHHPESVCLQVPQHWIPLLIVR